ncbi:hypothetical protein TIFTF001_030021 [Ficus carica]|uniref:Uncharacterized protein n=1 Tax=Ficus carica TaxID=3494 RepID=A0AA88DTG2_FICCA|nr:hypothetical protein TIFTF001_030021 [Ficus carica]
MTARGENAKTEPRRCSPEFLRKSSDGAKPSSVTATTKKRCRRLQRRIPVDDDVDCRRRSAKVERG